MATEEITKLVEESVTKENDFAPQIDFKEQTPDVLLKTEKPDPLYEKAFLSREDKSKTEYAQNTTTWD